MPLAVLMIACLALLAAAGPAGAFGVAVDLPDTRSAIEKDVKATLRYIDLQSKRMRGMIDRGDTDGALGLEKGCLRHERKSLERYLWYVKKDKVYSDRVDPLKEALDELTAKDPEQSLEDRQAREYEPLAVIADPLGLSPTSK